MTTRTPALIGFGLALTLAATACATDDVASDHTADDGDALVVDDKADADVHVSARKLSVPRGLSNEQGYLGMMHVEVTGGRRFSTAALDAVLMAGHKRFGDECDGVEPDGWTQIRPATHPVPELLRMLREDTDGWAYHLDAPEVTQLGAYLDRVGAGDIRVFEGISGGQVCGGDGTVDYLLIWNKRTNDVLYLIQYVYAE